VFGKGAHLLERAIGPVLPHVEHGGHAAEAHVGAAGHGEAAGHGMSHLLLELGLMAVSLCVAVVGIWWAWNWYAKRKGEPAARAAGRAPWLYRALWNRWWVDEIYWGLVLHPYRRACNWLRGFDEWAVDGVINGSAGAYRGGSRVAHWFDLIVVDGLVNLLGWVSKGFAWLFRRVQTGVVGNYLYFVVAGLFVLLGIYVFLVVL
jgi:NADH-quinone oxidoreductase subunit L